MRLKSLEICGFKSFPDKVRFWFGEGITAIVGPNGCGKTNILDALRWAMGEQTLSVLRCDRTEELIFAGGGGKDPLGYAEAKAVFENDSARPEFGAEIEVRRRFFRSGESEYFLNRQLCKLRDLQELFSGFGGGRAYAIFDQASIRMVISGAIRPLLEEAARIAVYRERRAASERKLALTEADLVRLSDIIAERERLVRSLRRQARQLALYNQVKEERDRLRLTQLKLEYKGLTAESLERKRALEALEAEEAKTLAAVQTLEADSGALREEARRLQVLEEEALRARNEYETRRSQLKAELALNRERLDQLVKAIASAEKELSSVAQMGAEVEARLEERTSALSEATSALAAIRAKLERKELISQEEELVGLREELRKTEAELKLRFKECQAQNKRYLRFEAELENLKAERLKLDHEIGALNARGAELAAEQKRLSSEINELEARRTSSEMTISELGEERLKLEAEEVELAEKAEGLDRRLRRLKATLATLRAQLAQDQERELSKVIRDVARLSGSIQARPGFEKAVEAGLHHLIDCFVVESLPELERLDRSQHWRFLLSQVRPELNLRARPDHPGVLGALAQFVRLRKPVPNLVQKLLDQTWVVKEEVFDELLHRYPDDCFVTPGGLAYLGGLGVVVVQSLKGGRLYWEAQLSYKEAEYAKALKAKQGLEERLEAVRAELKQSAALIKDHEATLQSLYRAKSELSGELKAIEGLSAETSSQLAGLVRERETLDGRLAQTNNSLKEAGTMVAELDRAIEQLQHRIEGLEAQIRAKEAELASSRDALNQELLRLAKLEERVQGLTREVEHLHRAQLEYRDRHLQLERGLAAKRSTQSELDDSLKELKLKHQALESEPLPEYNPARLEELLKRQRALDEELPALRQSLERIRSQLLGSRLSYQELVNRERMLAQRAETDYGVVLAEYEPEPVENLKERLELIERRLTLLSRANPLAQEDYEREEAALSELITQRSDVQAARQNLLDTIKEIDDRVVEEFRTRFERVRTEFQVIFTRLFEGGEADLILEDPKDLWGSPIAIVAKPKGKSLKRLEQLSEGEKTLLALSLLFALHRTSPAPFCFLDEVDAPLDDSNVVRFVDFLKELSAQTQIVIITHNRYTIEQAQNIYGVTMEQPGVSLVVSVRLAQLTKEVV